MSVNKATLRTRYMRDGFVDQFDCGVTDALKGYKPLTRDKFDYQQAYDAYLTGYNAMIEEEEQTHVSKG